MDSAEVSTRLRSAGVELSQSVDRLTRSLTELDEASGGCAGLAARYDDFAVRMAAEYPALAGPASELAVLFRELDVALARVNTTTSALVGKGGSLADGVIGLTQEC